MEQDFSRIIQNAQKDMWVVYTLRLRKEENMYVKKDNDDEGRDEGGCGLRYVSQGAMNRAHTSLGAP